MIYDKLRWVSQDRKMPYGEGWVVELEVTLRPRTGMVFHTRFSIFVDVLPMLESDVFFLGLREMLVVE